MAKESRGIHLGFEMETGEPVEVGEPRHLFICGLTNESGKTTTLEALAFRSNMTVLAFLTKPGEEAFLSLDSLVRHKPFYRAPARADESLDWRYVASILESTMREKMRFERAWIIRASKGAKTLADVRENIWKALEDPKVKGLSHDVYTTLEAYLDIVVPEMERADFAADLRLAERAVNVMDLRHLPDEVQALVIAATLSEVHGRGDIVTIIPEAWKFLPEGRRGPVLLAAERVIRQGAANRCLVWLDSQDISGVSKVALKSVGTWLLGRQTEKNEVEHTLRQIPLPPRQRPKVEDIMSLGLGQFYLCQLGKARKTYVQPHWMDAETAKGVAMGDTTLGMPTRPETAKEDEDMKFKEMYEQERRQNAELRKHIEQMGAETRHTVRRVGVGKYVVPRPDVVDIPPAKAAILGEDVVTEPVSLVVGKTQPTLEVRIERPVIEAREDDNKGRVALLISEGFFDQPRSGTDIAKAYAQRGWPNVQGGNARSTMLKMVEQFARWYFLRIEGDSYAVMPGVKKRITTGKA